jgi:hypothetical protein
MSGIKASYTLTLTSGAVTPVTEGQPFDGYCRAVTLRAHEDNTDPIRVGNSDVDAESLPLFAKESLKQDAIVPGGICVLAGAADQKVYVTIE